MAKSSLLNGKAKGAFTLIEILVVLVIMGFLVSMVAPKLSGIVDTAVDTTCDTNQERLRKVLNVYVNQNNSLPGGLINLVKYHTNYATVGNVAIPLADDNDKSSASGKEWLSNELVARMKPKVHFLTTSEAEELVSLGLKQVRILAKVPDAAALALTKGDAEDDNIAEENVQAPVAQNLPVFMIGVGDEDQSGTIDNDEFATGNVITVDASSEVTETNTTASIYLDAVTGNIQGAITAAQQFVRFDEGKALGRIVMGVSNFGTLVQEGLLDEAGVCPGAVQRADHHKWGNYLVILPRLAGTMELLKDIDGDGTEAAVQYIALDAETGTEADGAKIIGRTPNAGFSHFKEQALSDITTACPEGHTWGSNAEAFAISFKD